MSEHFISSSKKEKMRTYLNNLGLKNQSSNEQLLEFISPEGVLYLVMNRPEVHNAFDSYQIKKLTKALENAKSNPKVRVVVLAGAGKSFCAGGDINYMKSMGQNSFEENKDIYITESITKAKTIRNNWYFFSKNKVKNIIITLAIIAPLE